MVRIEYGWAVIAGITDAIGIGLAGVRHRWTVVARVANRVCVSILLLWVGNGWAVVAGVGNQVAVLIRLAARPRHVEHAALGVALALLELLTGSVGQTAGTASLQTQTADHARRDGCETAIGSGDVGLTLVVASPRHDGPVGLQA